MRKISILGSTGSIGKTTLKVIAKNSSHFKVEALAVFDNIKLLEKQIKVFTPKVVSVWDIKKAEILRAKISRLKVKVLSGREGLLELASLGSADTIVFAMSGMNGLLPLFEAIRQKKNIAIANKELLVIAGEIIMREVKRCKINFVPIDSEHSAIFQCLNGEKIETLRRIILTASGGPFLNLPPRKFSNITQEQALNHPKWKMGKKISIDSATMMNKGLEVIEASFLYGVSVEKIDVIIHPQSIIHSFVEFIDGSIMAQLSSTNMFFPISYALSYPDRIENKSEKLDLYKVAELNFMKPDMKKFKCLSLAFKAAKIGNTMPAVLNAANEVAVYEFLNNKINFLDIPLIVEKVMRKHKKNLSSSISLKNILKADVWAKKEATKLCQLL